MSFHRFAGFLFFRPRTKGSCWRINLPEFPRWVKSDILLNAPINLGPRFRPEGAKSPTEITPSNKTCPTASRNGKKKNKCWLVEKTEKGLLPAGNYRERSLQIFVFRDFFNINKFSLTYQHIYRWFVHWIVIHNSRFPCRWKNVFVGTLEGIFFHNQTKNIKFTFHETAVEPTVVWIA